MGTWCLLLFSFTLFIQSSYCDDKHHDLDSNEEPAVLTIYLRDQEEKPKTTNDPTFLVLTAPLVNYQKSLLDYGSQHSKDQYENKKESSVYTSDYSEKTKEKIKEPTYSDNDCNHSKLHLRDSSKSRYSESKINSMKNYWNELFKKQQYHDKPLQLGRCETKYLPKEHDSDVKKDSHSYMDELHDIYKTQNSLKSYAHMDKNELYTDHNHVMKEIPLNYPKAHSLHEDRHPYRSKQHLSEVNSKYNKEHRLNNDNYQDYKDSYLPTTHSSYNSKDHSSYKAKHQDSFKSYQHLMHDYRHEHKKDYHPRETFHKYCDQDYYVPEIHSKYMPKVSFQQPYKSPSRLYKNYASYYLKAHHVYRKSDPHQHSNYHLPKVYSLNNSEDHTLHKESHKKSDKSYPHSIYKHLDEHSKDYHSYEDYHPSLHTDHYKPEIHKPFNHKDYSHSYKHHPCAHKSYPSNQPKIHEIHGQYVPNHPKSEYKHEAHSPYIHKPYKDSYEDCLLTKNDMHHPKEYHRHENYHPYAPKMQTPFNYKDYFNSYKHHPHLYHNYSPDLHKIYETYGKYAPEPNIYQTYGKYNSDYPKGDHKPDIYSPYHHKSYPESQSGFYKDYYHLMKDLPRSKEYHPHEDYHPYHEQHYAPEMYIPHNHKDYSHPSTYHELYKNNIPDHHRNHYKNEIHTPHIPKAQKLYKESDHGSYEDHHHALKDYVQEYLKDYHPHKVYHPDYPKDHYRPEVEEQYISDYHHNLHKHHPQLYKTYAPERSRGYKRDIHCPFKDYKLHKNHQDYVHSMKRHLQNYRKEYYPHENYHPHHQEEYHVPEIHSQYIPKHQYHGSYKQHPRLYKNYEPDYSKNHQEHEKYISDKPRKYQMHKNHAHDLLKNLEFFKYLQKISKFYDTHK